MAVSASCAAIAGSASSADVMMSAFLVARSAVAGSADVLGDGAEEHAAAAKSSVVASVDLTRFMIGPRVERNTSVSAVGG